MLFLLYIDDLHSVVPETVKMAHFADDVSLISNYQSKLVAEMELQGRQMEYLQEDGPQRRQVRSGLLLHKFT